MKNTMLAILAVALAALAPFALAAEGQGDNDGDGNKQPTMAELGNKVDSIVRQLGSLSATTGSLRTELGTLRTELGALATTVGTLSSTVSANHTTIVGKFAPQMAVVMSVPYWWSGWNGAGANITKGQNPPLHLVGESTIPGFPAGTVGADGLFTDATLPAGTYLFELQQPYGDNAICQSELSRRHLPGTSERYKAACPSVRLHPFSNRTRLEDGYGIYTYAAPTRFRLAHKWPTGLKHSEDTALSATERESANSIASYTGAVRITKLK